ncbi:MAG: PH domain-containing protein [Haloarculaceae archaeon]
MTTQPTIRPTLIRTVILVVVVIALFVVLQTNPTLLGDEQITNTTALVVAVLGVIATIRFAIRIFVLRRIRYEITKDRVQRRFSLFFKTQSRGVPFDRVRSHELTQNRVQKLMGFGTIALNQGLGGLKLENVQNPHEVYRAISKLSDRA